ncbi:hypothetical protein LTR85_006637 [Meristemomyces frigidus]|nr:hypothetical protein LTR85_006637 [Meristemomyces frigidus]
MDATQVPKKVPAQQAIQASFSGLPPEMRNMIHHLVIADLYPASSNILLWQDAVKLQPALSLLSRQIRREVVPIYYSKLTLVVDGSSASALDAFRLFVADAEESDVTCTGIQHLGFLFPCTRTRAHCDRTSSSDFVLITVSKTPKTSWRVTIQRTELGPIPSTSGLDVSGASGKTKDAVPNQAASVHKARTIRLTGIHDLGGSRRALSLLASLLQIRVSKWTSQAFRAAAVLEICDFIETNGPRLLAKYPSETPVDDHQPGTPSVGERVVAMWVENASSAGAQSDE